MLSTQFPLLARDSTQDLSNKVLLYKTVIRTVLTNIVLTWGQRVKAPAGTKQDLDKVLTIGKFCHELGTKFFETSAMHFNCTIAQAVQYEPDEVFANMRPSNA